MFYAWPAGEVFLILPTPGGGCEGCQGAGGRGAANRSMKVANGGPGRSDTQSGGTGRVRLGGFFYL